MKLFLQGLKPVIIVLMIIVASPAIVFSQTPISISGFNHDIVAESGNNSLATTSIPVDGATISNKVMYNVTFRNLNGFGGGALPDNGTIFNASGTYKLAAYTSNNALLLQRGQNGDITINTPAKYSSLRIAAFSTEGPSAVNITLHFSDGSSTTALTNYNLPDWFNGTGNLIETGFGRCKRTTTVLPSDADAFPNNPRLYYIDIPIVCPDNTKDLQKINIANVTTAGTNAPYPNTVVMAVSGSGYSGVNAFVTNATCVTNGSVTLNSIPVSPPFTITWNTNPVQTGVTATNLPAGNYIATITGNGSCVITQPVTIGLINTLFMSSYSGFTICDGGSSPSTNILTNAQAFSWSPTSGVSNPAISNPMLSPAVTTTYTVTGTLGSCSQNRTFTVTVIASPELNIQQDTTICIGSSFSANVSGNATSYSWSPTTAVSNPSIINPVLSPTLTTAYTVTATTGNCSISKTFTVNVVPGLTVFAGNDVSITQGQSTQLQGSGSQGTYLWTPSNGLSATDILNPIANPAVTTTYTLSITSAQGCTGTDAVDVKVVPNCIKPMEAITPNGDGINDRWLVTNGNCIGNAGVHVYNRYGSPVYENKDYKNDWQGTFKGKPLPDATYYYVIEYKLQGGRNVMLKGNLSILR